MSSSPLSPHLASPAELTKRIDAERFGAPFLLFRDAEGHQQIHPLEAGEPTTIGRAPECAVSLEWDSQVSALHAELRRTGREWLIVDDGLSRNGTYVNGDRVVGRRRLRDLDEVRLGGAVVIFRSPGSLHASSTVDAAHGANRPELTPAQRRVLVALCRPFAGGDAYTRPATNQEIANELQLTVAAVKTHLRSLFQRFGLDKLPPNEKRAALVRLAFQTGAVSGADVGRPASR